MKKAVAAVCALLMTIGTAHASCNTKGCDNTTIDFIYLRSDGHIQLKLYDNMEGADCTLYSGGYFTLYASHPNADRIYAGLLSAHMAGKAVRKIRIATGSTGCEVNYVLL